MHFVSVAHQSRPEHQGHRRLAQPRDPGDDADVLLVQDGLGPVEALVRYEGVRRTRNALAQPRRARPLTVAACPCAAPPATRARLATSVMPIVTNRPPGGMDGEHHPGVENFQQPLEPALAGRSQERPDRLALPLSVAKGACDYNRADYAAAFMKGRNNCPLRSRTTLGSGRPCPLLAADSITVPAP